MNPFDRYILAQYNNISPGIHVKTPAAEDKPGSAPIADLSSNINSLAFKGMVS